MNPAVKLKQRFAQVIRKLHFVRTAIPSSKIRSDVVKDSLLLESCVRTEGKSHLKMKPNFRICYLPPQVAKLEQTQQFLESEPPLIAMSIPQFHKYSDNQRMEQKIVVDSVYISEDVDVAHFFCPVPKFPDSAGKYSLRELILNPPNGILLFYHPSFEIHDIFSRFQSIFKEACKILCCMAGVFGDNNRAFVFPSGDDDSQESRQHGQYGASGLIFYGDISSEDMAWLARRISGRYLLGSVMSPVLQKTLFVPRSKPSLKKLNPYRPNMIVKSVPIFSMGEIIFVSDARFDHIY